MASMFDDQKQEQGASDATQKDEATTETEQKVPAPAPVPAAGDSNAEIPLDVHLLEFVRAPAPSAVKIEASAFNFPMIPLDTNSTQELWAPEPITASEPNSNL